MCIPWQSHESQFRQWPWIPAFAGMTDECRNNGYWGDSRRNRFRGGNIPAPILVKMGTRGAGDYFRFISAGSVFLK